MIVGPGAVSSAWLERLLDTQEVRGSTPLRPPAADHVAEASSDNVRVVDSARSDQLDVTDRLASILYSRFVAFHALFIDITQRARSRFLARDWTGHQRDARERLVLHTREVLDTVESCRRLLPGAECARQTWIGVQQRYVARVSERGDMEIAETFYNSVTRRLFNIVGVDKEMEFLWLGPVALPADDAETGEYRSFEVREGEVRDSAEATIREILRQCPLGDHFADLPRDARLVARRIDEYIKGSWLGLDSIDVLKPVFYRNRGAYLVGRMRWLNRVSPCILPIVHNASGVHVDAVLLAETATSRLFSYARSYMHVMSCKPAAVISFLKSMLPVKPVAELYTSLGYSQHGKTNLFRALFRHMEHSNSRFERTRGAAGMVMAVFALPSFDVVFKVIKDRFPPVKKTTPEGVKQRYTLVFGYDRVGRLVDAQEFENLTFARDRFDEELLDELRRECSRTVAVTRDEVILGHVYTERQVYPLDLYLNEMAPERAYEAAIDYGNAIKDLAAANIFPGDLFPKNFGVTRLGNVVFYDYDELALLSEMNFRAMPKALYEDDEFLDEPWFSVASNDVFPEEFTTFLRYPAVLGEMVERHHPELVTLEFWKRMQERQKSGEVPEFYPYHQSMRLPHSGARRM